MNTLHLLMAIVPLSSQDDPVADAKAILDQLQQHAGPEPDRLALKSLQAEGKSSWKDLEGRGKFVELFAFPKVRIATDFENFGVHESGYDGEVVWESDPLGVTVRWGADAAEVVGRYGRMQHRPWQEHYSEAKLVGRGPVGDIECHQIAMTPHECADTSKPDTWWISVEEPRLLRLNSRSVGDDGQPTEVQTDYSDWRRVEGLLFPHRKETTVSGFVLIQEYTSYQLNATIPGDRFELPEAVVDAAQRGDHRGTGGKKPEIQVESLEERHIASVRVQCKQADLQRQLATLLPETLQYVMSVGAQMNGPPLVRYHSFAEEMDIEAAMPVTEAVKGGGRVKAETLPAGDAVVAWHVGNYDKLGETHLKIQAYLTEHKLAQRASAWEEYWTDPGMEPDPAKWRTRIVYPVKPVADDDESEGSETR